MVKSHGYIGLLAGYNGFAMWSKGGQEIMARFQKYDRVLQGENTEYTLCWSSNFRDDFSHLCTFQVSPTVYTLKLFHGVLNSRFWRNCFHDPLWLLSLACTWLLLQEVSPTLVLDVGRAIRDLAHQLKYFSSQYPLLKVSQYFPKIYSSEYSCKPEPKASLLHSFCFFTFWNAVRESIYHIDQVNSQ